MSLVAITGANGFVGNALVKRLGESPGCSVLAVTRKSYDISAVFSGVRSLVVPDFSEAVRFEKHFVGVDVLVHAAARVHVMNDTGADPLAEFRKVNCSNTLALADAAAKSGIKRFVFISSVKVNGEQTMPGKPFRSDDQPAPGDAYGISKAEAELGLWKIAQETGMQVVIIRPPLVYGAGVKGNFANMCKLVAKGFPLPLGTVHNQRSLVALDNLVDLIITCIDHPAAANQVFLAGDGQDLSTTELLRGVADAMSKPSRLIPFPSSLLMLGATLFGKKDMAQRLLGSLQVDISHTCKTLGWKPPISVEEGLRRCFDNTSDKR